MRVLQLHNLKQKDIFILCTLQNYQNQPIGLINIFKNLLNNRRVILMISKKNTLPQEINASRDDEDPIWVTPESIDPLYNQPVIDSQEDLVTPVPHRKVSGHFEGTEKRFSFYFPSESLWEGRFFQVVYPTYDENATDTTVSFGADSGAYTVQTNGGGGYRVDAAAAKYSRTLAAQYYNALEHIYGYVYGGSGGSLQTSGAIENTSGVWDGSVLVIPAIPTSIPNNFFIRGFALFILGDKASLIADAVSPGGSGNPYAALNEVEQSVLSEVTKLGVPLKAWEDYLYLLHLNDPENLFGFASMVKEMDPDYAQDFWSQPGYLGTEESELGAIFRNARIDYVSTVEEVNRDEQGLPVSLVLDGVPENLSNIGMDFMLYQPDGTTEIGTLSGTLDADAKTFTIGNGNSATTLSAISEGVKLRSDNSWLLALTSFHRHQVPLRSGFYPWDHLRTPEGTPLYPQRQTEIGPIVSSNTAGGGTHTGNIQCKLIIVANLLDVDAYPWHGDWYRAQVAQSLGEDDNDNCRLWYNENADHVGDGPRTHRLVQFDGIVQQALRDVSAWVESGASAAESTSYEVTDSQIIVEEDGAARHGIQPAVNLTVNGAERVEVETGQNVAFMAAIQVPEGFGEIVGIEWDWFGNGDFEPSPLEELNGTVVNKVFSYDEPGIYYPVLRVSSQREGDPDTSFARVQNLGRVRVVVL